MLHVQGDILGETVARQAEARGRALGPGSSGISVQAVYQKEKMLKLSRDSQSAHDYWQNLHQEIFQAATLHFQVFSHCLP